MKLLLSVDRIRSIAAAAGTEKELESLLRKHKIRFSWTTAPGYLPVFPAVPDLFSYTVPAAAQRRFRSVPLSL